MYFVGLDNDNRITAYLEADVNPDENLWIDSPWDVPPEDFDDWLYVDGVLVYNPRDLPPAPMTATEVLTAMFAAAPETMKELPDSALCRMAAYMQPWASGTVYAVGDLREYMELPYRCLQAHTSQETWTPPDAPSLWAKVLRSPDIPEWEQPSSTNPYMKGDKVRHNGKTWVSDVDNNVWEPGVYGWTEM